MRHSKRVFALATGAAALLAAVALSIPISGVSVSSVALAQAPAAKPVTDYKPIQDHLYGLNYNVGERNGQLTPQLKGAIEAWRKNRRSTATGDMTDAEAKQLLAISLPKVWAAIAYSAAGPHGAVTGKPTREAAEKEAAADCEKQSRKCTIVAAVGTACAAVATFSGQVNGKTGSGAWGSHRPKLEEARQAAVAQCKTNAPSADSCAVKEAVCADGSHKK